MLQNGSHRKSGIFLDIPFLLIVVLLLVSVFVFNNVITVDSQGYYKLSQQVWASWEGWDVARTPLFPFLLALTDCIFGKGPFTFVLLNTFFLALACSLFCDILVKLEVHLYFRFVGVLAFVTPVMLTYQHSFLSEAGLVLVLMSIVWVALYNFTSSYLRYLCLGLVMVVAYYYKPHFKYFAWLIFFLVYFSVDLRFLIRKPEIGWLNSVKAPAIGIILFILIILPWDLALQRSGRFDTLNYFPLAMGVVPADAKYLGANLENYKKALVIPGGIPRSGIPGHLIYPLLNTPNKHLLAVAIFENPSGYVVAVFKTLSNYILSPAVGSENLGFLKGVTGTENGLNRTKIYYVPDSMADLNAAVTKRFDTAYRPGLISKSFEFISPALNLIVALLFCLLPVSFFYSVKTKNSTAFVASGAALGYLGMHAIALMCIDRYAAPTIPLVFLAVIAAFFVSRDTQTKF